MGNGKRSFAGGFGAFLGLIGMSAVAGLLVTVAVTPALTVSGLAASSSISLFENLPSYLNIGELAEGSNIYATAADGSTVKLATFYEQNREEVPLGEHLPIRQGCGGGRRGPPLLLPWRHRSAGNSPGDRQAPAQTGGGGGGSSLTQQYVKNVLVQNAVMSAKTEEERTAAIESAIRQEPDRKLKEMRLAIGLEKKFTKNEILTGYLNIAFFGGTRVRHRGGQQVLLRRDQREGPLAGAGGEPDRHRELSRRIFGSIARTAKTTGPPTATPETRIDATTSSTEMLLHKKITPGAVRRGGGRSGHPGDHTADIRMQDRRRIRLLLRLRLLDDPQRRRLGCDVEERVERLRRGGLDIYTTLDLGLQVASEAAVNENVPSVDPRFDVGSTAVTVQPATGRILAMAQNKTFSNDPEVLEANGPGWTSINYNTDIDYGGSSGFQPGSTYKVFTLGEWVNAGHSLRETLRRSQARPSRGSPTAATRQLDRSPFSAAQ